MRLIVDSRLLRRVDGLVVVVPNDCCLPWPRRKGVTPLDEPMGEPADPLEPGEPGVLKGDWVGEEALGESKMFWLKLEGGEDGSDGVLGAEAEGEAGRSSSA